MIYALSAIISIMAMPISAVQPVRNEEQPMQGSASQSEAATSTSPSDGIRKAITPESHRDQHGVTSMSPSDGIRKASTPKSQRDQHGVDKAVVRRGVQVTARGDAHMARASVSQNLSVSFVPPSSCSGGPNNGFAQADSSGECLEGYELILDKATCLRAKETCYPRYECGDAGKCFCNTLGDPGVDHTGDKTSQGCITTSGFGADACIAGGVATCRRDGNNCNDMPDTCPVGSTPDHNMMLFPKGCYADYENKRVFYTGNEGDQGDQDDGLPGNQVAGYLWIHGPRTYYVLCRQCDGGVCPTDAPTESPTANPTANPTATPTDSPTDSPTESPTATPTADPITAALRCKAILNEHWAAGINSTTATALVGNKSGVWNDNFKQGETRVLSGAGTHSLGELENKVSSVKVEGACCLARAFDSIDCSGDALNNGTFIAYNTLVVTTPAEKLPEGVVTPAEELTKYWGCNDCARCIQLEYNCTPS